MVWVLGYVGHMVTDAVVHPIVNEIVERFQDEIPEVHQEAEMTQDSFVLEEAWGSGIKAAEASSLIKQCSADRERNRDLDVIFRDWAAGISENLVQAVLCYFGCW